MTRYKHRTLENIEVDADQVGQHTYAPLAHRLGAHVVKEINPETWPAEGSETIGLNVLTSDGWQRASEGDWVLDSATGIFVLGNAHFQLMYEEIDTRDDHHDLFAQRGGKINGKESRSHDGSSND